MLQSFAILIAGIALMTATNALTHGRATSNVATAGMMLGAAMALYGFFAVQYYAKQRAKARRWFDQQRAREKYKRRLKSTPES